MLAWLGGRITGRPATGAMSHPAVAVLIGGALVLILYVVPVLGFLVYKLLGFLGLGAVVYTLILASQANRAAREALCAAAPQAPASPAARPQRGARPDTPHAAAAAAAARRRRLRQRPPAAAACRRCGAAQPINAALPRAGFWIRMVALLLDVLLVGFLLERAARPSP